MDEGVFHFGEWQISPLTNSILNGVERRHVEPRAMDVLVALCRHPQQVVSSEDLLAQCWGSAESGDNPVHKTITQLRRALGDTASASRYIETIRKRGYRTVAEVTVAQPDATPAAWREISPFRGLQAFFEDHAAIFFGRREATAQLRHAVALQCERGLAMQLVLGPSGSGKTSLIRAGLLPELLKARQGAMSADVRDVATLDAGEIGQHSLFVALASVMLDWQAGAHNVFEGASADSLSARLQHDLPAVVNDMRLALPPDADGNSARFALFIDRLEALFTLPQLEESVRRQFLQLLADLAASGCVLVIAACRNDFYPRLAEYPLLMEPKQHGGHFDLGPPSPTEIGQIIRLPAQAAGLGFGTDPVSQRRLDDVLCEAAGHSPDALPLLQYALHELYRLRGSDNVLSFAAFDQLGGMEGAVGHRAEEVIATLNPLQRSALPRILSLVVTISANDDAVTGRRAPWAALKNQAERDIVAMLVESRLFVSELVGSEAGFGVAHEALLRRWPRVTEWINTHRDALRTRARLAQHTARWLAEGKSADLLIPPGKQLDEARAVASLPALSLSVDELALITASGRGARLRKHVRIGALTIMVTLALMAGVLGAMAIASGRTAQMRRDQAEDLMGYMLGDFADKLRQLGRLDLLDGISNKALVYLQTSRNDSVNLTAVIQRAKALLVIGEVRTERGERKTAQQAFDEAHDLLMAQVAKTPSDGELLKQTGISAFWLGRLALEADQPLQAKRWFNDYLIYSTQRSKLDPANVDGWIEQSYAHSTLGALAERHGTLAEAEAEFNASIDLQIRARVRQPLDRTLSSNLAEGISWLATLRERQGNLPAAMQGFSQEREISQALHDAAPNEVLWIQRLQFAYQHQAGIKVALGQDAAALDDYRQAARLVKEALRLTPDNQTLKVEPASIDYHMARIRRTTESPAVLLTEWRDITERLHRASLDNPESAQQVELEAGARSWLADALYRLRQDDEARVEMDHALRSIEQAYLKNPTKQRTRMGYAEVLLRAAHHTSETKSARVLCDRAQTVLAAEPADSMSYRVLQARVQAGLCLGQDTAVRENKRKLEQIGFRSSSYLQAISVHP